MKIQTIRDLIDQYGYRTLRLVAEVPQQASTLRITGRAPTTTWCGRHSMGWIGSHNFTKASERTAQELGIVFRGRGPIEARLMQQALLQLDAWEYETRANRKLI